MGSRGLLTTLSQDHAVCLPSSPRITWSAYHPFSGSRCLLTILPQGHKVCLPCSVEITLSAYCSLSVLHALFTILWAHLENMLEVLLTGLARHLEGLSHAHFLPFCSVCCSPLGASHPHTLPPCILTRHAPPVLLTSDTQRSFLSICM